MSPEISRRQMLVTGAAVAGTAAVLAPLTSAAAATGGGAAKAKPTIVLVHGGYADSSCWNQTLSYLQGEGYSTICGANPLRGIPTDAPYIASLLDSIAGPVVLVGHSMGGTVITNAAAGKSNVRALVYISAFVPDVGETQGDLINKYPGSEVLPVSVPVTYTKADGTTGTDLYLSADGQAASAETRPSRPQPSGGCTAVRTPARSSRWRPRPTARCSVTPGSWPISLRTPPGPSAEPHRSSRPAGHRPRPA